MSPGKAAFFGALLGGLAVAAAVLFGMSTAARELADHIRPPSPLPTDPGSSAPIEAHRSEANPTPNSEETPS